MSQNCDNPGALAWVFYDICRFGSPKGRHWYTPGYTGSNKENWTALATVLSAITEVLQHEVRSTVDDIQILVSEAAVSEYLSAYLH